MRPWEGHALGQNLKSYFFPWLWPCGLEPSLNLSKFVSSVLTAFMKIRGKVFEHIISSLKKNKGHCSLASSIPWAWPPP